MGGCRTAQGMRGGGGRLLKHAQASLPALLTGCLPSASSQLGVSRGGLHCPYLTPPNRFVFFVFRDRKASSSTLAPSAASRDLAKAIKTLQVENNNADTLPSQSSALPTLSKICNNLGAWPQAWSPPMHEEPASLCSEMLLCLPRSYSLYIYIFCCKVSLQRNYILF